mgnify:CR=1 FL=1
MSNFPTFPNYEVRAWKDAWKTGTPADVFYLYAPTIDTAVLLALRWFGSGLSRFTLWKDGTVVYEFDSRVVRA